LVNTLPASRWIVAYLRPDCFAGATDGLGILGIQVDPSIPQDFSGGRLLFGV
jgi:hypothetical protein